MCNTLSQVIVSAQGTASVKRGLRYMAVRAQKSFQCPHSLSALILEKIYELFVRT